MIRLARVSALAALGLAGCVAWSAPETRRRVVRSEPAPVRLVAAEPRVTGQIAPDGVAHLRLHPGGRCRRPRRELHRVTRTERRELTTAGRFALGWGAFLPVAGGGLWLLDRSASDEGDSSSLGAAVFAGTLAVSVALVAPTLYQRYARGPRRTSMTEEVVTGGAATRCPPDLLPPLPPALTVRLPWGAELTARADPGGRIALEVDWSRTGVDPLAEETAAVLAEPWTIAGGDRPPIARWTPERHDVSSMVRAIGEATDTETIVETGGPPPDLRIASFAATGLRGGAAGRITVKLRNRGRGAAYRVVARTRSGHRALDGLQLSFGLLRPGEVKIRSLDVEVPPQKRGTREVVILSLGEANGHAPPPGEQFVDVAPSPRAALQLACALRGDVDRSGKRPVVDAGGRVVVRCAVENGGVEAARGVRLRVSLGGGAQPASAGPVDLVAGAKVDLAGELTVPRNAELDQRLEIRARASSRSGASAEWTAEVYAGAPLLCPQKLSRAEFRKRRAALRKARDAGALDEDEYDAAHADLVRCLDNQSSGP